jgi:hypothetical protein
MEFQWPAFAEAVVIDPSRSWTAAFDSYDQRHDNCYYIVTLCENGKAPRRFMAQVDVGWAGDDWTTPEFTSRLRERIDWVARAGATNTSYSGPL